MKDIKFNLKDKEVETNFDIVKKAVDAAETEEARLEVDKLDATTDTWNTATLENSWVAYGSGRDTAKYILDSDGYVHLKGTVKNGTIGTVVFTLPAAYRPAYWKIFPVVTGAAFGYCLIATNGQVTAAAGSNSDFTFDGMIFMVGE